MYNEIIQLATVDLPHIICSVTIVIALGFLIFLFVFNLIGEIFKAVTNFLKETIIKITINKKSENFEERAKTGKLKQRIAMTMLGVGLIGCLGLVLVENKPWLRMNSSNTVNISSTVSSTSNVTASPQVEQTTEPKEDRKACLKRAQKERFDWQGTCPK